MNKSFSYYLNGLLVLAGLFLFSGCYSFRDVSIPEEVKTVRVQYFENKPIVRLPHPEFPTSRQPATD